MVISRALHINEATIGLTIVAIGTTLPELVTAIVAATKRKTDFIIGSMIGSNVFNVLLILGLSSTVKPLSYNPDFNTDVVLCGLFALLLLAFLLMGKQHPVLTMKRNHYALGRWQGATFITIYILYIFFVAIKR
jgi:cation:H+ antiporter